MGTALSRLRCSCSLVPLEKNLFKWIRGLSKFGLVAFDGVCISLVAFELAFPLIWANASSFKDAESSCQEHAIQLREDNTDLAELEYVESGAGWSLLPLHFLNATATAVSLFQMLLWLHCSTHRSEQAIDLDRKRELGASSMHQCFTPPLLHLTTQLVFCEL